MSRSGLPADYGTFLGEIKSRIRSAQYEALRKVNKELVALYWDIGRMIVERQTKAGYGDAVVEQLAEFHAAYKDDEKVQPLVAQIAWSHNLVILQRCKDPLEREFYIRMTKKFGWSRNVLVHQIENQSYEKTLLGQTMMHASRSAWRPTASSSGCPGS